MKFSNHKWKQNISAATASQIEMCQKRKMKSQKRITTAITAAALAFSSLPYKSFAAVPATEDANMGLRSAVHTALDHNPSLLETNEKINQTATEIPIARALIMPNLSVIATGNHQKDEVNTGGASTARFDGDPYNLYTTTLKLSQPLFQLGSFSGINAAQKDLDISRWTSRASIRDLTNSVIQAYFQIVLNSRNVHTLQEQQKLVKESVNVALRRERTGRGQLLDVLQLKTQVALLDAQISTAQNALEVSVANLANLMGDNSMSQIKLKDKLEAPDIDEVDKSLDLKHYQIPEIEKDILSLDKISDLRQVNWGQNLPTLALVGTYNFNSYKQSDLYDSSSVSWTIGLQLTIPLFSGLSSIYQDKSLLSQQYQFEFDKKNVENQVLLQQVTSRKNLETALDSIETGVEALKLATASSKEAVRQFSNATIDFLQLLTTEQSYVQAEQSLNQYKYNYIVALANYYVASGQDMEQLVGILEKVNE